MDSSSIPHNDRPLEIQSWGQLRRLACMERETIAASAGGDEFKIETVTGTQDDLTPHAQISNGDDEVKSRSTASASKNGSQTHSETTQKNERQERTHTEASSTSTDEDKSGSGSETEDEDGYFNPPSGYWRLDGEHSWK